MTDREPGPDVRQLLQAFLDRLDPLVRAAAEGAGDEQREPGACQQVWCPVCALAALASGQQHPLLSVIAEHSATLLTALRAMTTDMATQPTTDRPVRPEAGPRDDDGAPAAGNGRYHHIPIVVEPAGKPPDPESAADTGGAES